MPWKRTNHIRGLRLSFRMDYSWSYFAVATIGVFIYGLVRFCEWVWKYIKSPVLAWFTRARAWCARTHAQASILVAHALEYLERIERQHQLGFIDHYIGLSLSPPRYQITVVTPRQRAYVD